MLPFGLLTACYVFTKLLRPLVKRWRSRGTRSNVYIDDDILVSKSEHQCLTDQKLVLSDLKQACRFCAESILHSREETKQAKECCEVNFSIRKSTCSGSR